MNGKNKKEMMEEFIHYHLYGDGEANGKILKNYADRNKLTLQERFDLAYFYSVTYCIISALFLLKYRETILNDPVSFAKNSKKIIIFQSDRRYVRVGNNYEKMLNCFSGRLANKESEVIEKMKKNGKLNMQKIESEVSNWYFFGRFSTYLFAETLGRLFGQDIGTTQFDWLNGDTATSGMMNLLCLDQSADYFDKYGKLPSNITTTQLDVGLRIVQQKIKSKGFTPITAEIETSLCAYRKFYKGSRYNGYYIDRILDELVKYKDFDEMKDDIQQIYEIRRQLFDKKYLGEYGGWKGIRSDLKHYYKETGKLT